MSPARPVLLAASFLISLGGCRSGAQPGMAEDVQAASDSGAPSLDEIDEADETDEIDEIDADGDGYGASEDCDDANPAVHPGAEELCNRVDDNCDGQTDEGVSQTVWDDADRDGFGDPSRPAQVCGIAWGQVYNDLDCDDTDASIQPGVVELCNGVDDNCDGVVDEAGAADAGPVWADADGDGFGDPDSASRACGVPDGSADNDEDCDDSDPAVSPAGTEVCDGGVDNDCNLWADDTDPGVVDATEWYIDRDGDGFGYSDYWQTACDQPVGFVDNASDCDDLDRAVRPGGVEVCNGEDDDCDGTTDDADASVDLSTGTAFYTDADADGYGDPALSSVSCSPAAGQVGNRRDCDDGDPAISPAATEICNAIDDDCDGLTDDEDAGVVLATGSTFYADADGDGYGALAYPRQACVVPAGFSASSSDCDDRSADIHPAATEVCNGLDDDCDGATDDDDAGVDLSTATTWYPDADFDGYGVTGATVVQCDEPSGYADAAGDCNDGSADVNPGAGEDCNAIDDDCDGVVDSAAACSDCEWVVDSDPTRPYLFCEDAGEYYLDALDACTDLGYELVTISSSSEHTFVYDAAMSLSTDRWWIGMDDITSEDEYRWESGEEVTYTSWASGEPNNDDEEDCVHFGGNYADEWNDTECWRTYPYICEAP